MGLKIGLTTEDWERLFGFYNKVAAMCYADEKAAPKRSEEFPGAKTMSQSEGRFGYRDMWYTGSNSKLGVSAGHSLLTVDRVPVWILEYWGWYDRSDERVLETLKEALLRGYTNDESRGGRGPEYFSSGDGQYSYQNTIRYGSHDGALILPEHYQTEPLLKRGQLNFSGYEQIFRKEKPTSSVSAYEVFRHDFVGFALIN